MKAQEIIQALALQKLPEEGGFFKEVYRSTKGEATDIYYLITPEEFSGLHRVKSSIEIFNFYCGDPAEMIQIDSKGELTRLVIGNDLSLGQIPKVNVAAGVWQGTRLAPGGKWALLGCTCIPAFEFSDFEGGTHRSLSRLFPQHQELIRQFTHS